MRVSNEPVAPHNECNDVTEYCKSMIEKLADNPFAYEAVSLKLEELLGYVRKIKISKLIVKMYPMYVSKDSLRSQIEAMKASLDKIEQIRSAYEKLNDERVHEMLDEVVKICKVEINSCSWPIVEFEV